MRIISKYKDFYDFLAQDHDADLVYVRKPFIVNGKFDSLYSPDCNWHMSSRHIPYRSWTRSKFGGFISVENAIFGIYPNVYSQPYMLLDIESVCSTKETFIDVLSKQWCEEFASLGTPKDRKEMLIDRAKMLVKKVLSSDGHFLKEPQKYTVSSDIDISRYLWKVECPEIFMNIGAPVFIRDDDYLTGLVYGGYEAKKSMEKKGKDGYAYIANICFNKLEHNVLKCWYDELNDLNTYINIENFLWSVKQEPEHVPDNDTKIINHGFDLKTSFRKM